MPVSWVTVIDSLSSTVRTVTVAERPSKVVLAEQVIFTVISPSTGVPEVGETVIQFSDVDTLQSRLQENEKDCVPPSRVKL